jgi:hypothetical protein
MPRRRRIEPFVRDQRGGLRAQLDEQPAAGRRHRVPRDPLTLLRSGTQHEIPAERLDGQRQRGRAGCGRRPVRHRRLGPQRPASLQVVGMDVFDPLAVANQDLVAHDQRMVAQQSIPLFGRARHVIDPLSLGLLARQIHHPDRTHGQIHAAGRNLAARRCAAERSPTSGRRDRRPGAALFEQFAQQIRVRAAPSGQRSLGGSVKPPELLQFDRCPRPGTFEDRDQDQTRPDVGQVQIRVRVRQPCRFRRTLRRRLVQRLIGFLDRLPSVRQPQRETGGQARFPAELHSNPQLGADPLPRLAGQRETALRQFPFAQLIQRVVAEGTDEKSLDNAAKLVGVARGRRLAQPVFGQRVHSRAIKIECFVRPAMQVGQTELAVVAQGDVPHESAVFPLGTAPASQRQQLVPVGVHQPSQRLDRFVPLARVHEPVDRFKLRPRHIVRLGHLHVLGKLDDLPDAELLAERRRAAGHSQSEQSENRSARKSHALYANVVRAGVQTASAGRDGFCGLHRLAACATAGADTVGTASGRPARR